MWIVWLIITIVMFLLEIATALLISIWFVAGAIIAMILATLGVNIYFQIGAFIIISTLVLIIGFHYRDEILMRRKKVATNVDRFIGKEGVVEEAFNPITGQGRALVNGVSWRIETTDSTPIPAGTLIIVKDIAGTRLIVTPKS